MVVLSGIEVSRLATTRPTVCLVVASYAQMLTLRVRRPSPRPHSQVSAAKARRLVEGTVHDTTHWSQHLIGHPGREAFTANYNRPRAVPSHEITSLSCLSMIDGTWSTRPFNSAPATHALVLPALDHVGRAATESGSNSIISVV